VRGQGTRCRESSSNGRPRDAGPRSRCEPEPPLSAEGKLRRAGTHREEPRFATERNTMNPRIGSRVQQTCTVGEDKTVEVVRNHGDGAREGPGSLSPKGDAATRNPGGGLTDSARWRGDLWTNPREAVRPAGRTAWIGTRRESRRQGQEGRVHMLSHVAHPGRRDLEGPDVRRKVVHRRSRRGAAKPTAAESTGGNFPRGRPPMGEADGANPFAAREARPCRSVRGFATY
jgi:hypothetical protein